MTESGFTPPDGGGEPPHAGEPPPQYGPPERHPPTGWVPPPPPPGWVAGRPGSLTAASILWIILGVFLGLAGIGEFATPSEGAAGDPASSAVALTFAGLGALFIVLAVQVQRGRKDARTALTVIGSISMFFVVPILFVVPALILQYRRGNKAWLDAHRTPPPGPWNRPNP